MSLHLQPYIICLQPKPNAYQIVYLWPNRTLGSINLFMRTDSRLQTYKFAIKQFNPNDLLVHVLAQRGTGLTVRTRDEMLSAYTCLKWTALIYIPYVRICDINDINATSVSLSTTRAHRPLLTTHTTTHSITYTLLTVDIVFNFSLI